MHFYMKYNVQFIFTINDISYDRLLYISQSFSIKQYIQAYHQCPITIRLQGTHKIIHTNLLLQESEKKNFLLATTMTLLSINLQQYDAKL